MTIEAIGPRPTVDGTNFKYTIERYGILSVANVMKCLERIYDDPGVVLAYSGQENCFGFEKL